MTIKTYPNKSIVLQFSQFLDIENEQNVVGRVFVKLENK